MFQTLDYVSAQPVVNGDRTGYVILNSAHEPVDFVFGDVTTDKRGAVILHAVKVLPMPVTVAKSTWQGYTKLRQGGAVKVMSNAELSAQARAYK